MTDRSILFANALFLLPCGCGDNTDEPAPAPPPPAQGRTAEHAAATLAGVLDVDGARRIACSNITVALANAVDTEAVMINVALLGPLEDAPPAVGETIEIDLGELPAALRVAFGTNLTREACNDTIEPSRAPVVEAEFLPLAGTIRIEVVEHLEVFPTYNARIGIDGVRFTHDGAPISLDLGTETFGWLPG